MILKKVNNSALAIGMLGVSLCATSLYANSMELNGKLINRTTLRKMGNEITLPIDSSKEAVDDITFQITGNKIKCGATQLPSDMISLIKSKHKIISNQGGMFVGGEVHVKAMVFQLGDLRSEKK